MPFGNQGKLDLNGRGPALFSFTERVTLLILQILGPSPLKAFHSRYLHHVCVIRCIPFHKPLVSSNIGFKRAFFLNFPELSSTPFKWLVSSIKLDQTRSLVITLLDLKNTFGEVYHNLIPEILKYYHIPDHIQQPVLSLYSNFQTSIVTSTFQTPFITVGRGVLQGDFISPLTFNLCFNTFIRYISDHKFKQFVFPLGSLYAIHWFQFADDASVITSLENENQTLLNHVTRWCTCANMIIRVDKCFTFGIGKSS